MKIFLFLIFLASSGCHYNYGIERSSHPPPFQNLYSSDDKQKYEFESLLYVLDEGRKQEAYVEIVHMSDAFNAHKSAPAKTGRRSYLSIYLSADSKISLVPGSVSLSHHSLDGTKIEPIGIDSTISKCDKGGYCNAYMFLSYPKNLPKKLIEKISFTLLIDGKEKHYDYEFPLEYQYNYSFFGSLMGV